MAGWNAAVEFSQVALHSTPDTLNVAAHAKVSCRVVISFSGVAKPLDAIVTRMSVRDTMAASSYPRLKKQFKCYLNSYINGYLTQYREYFTVFGYLMSPSMPPMTMVCLPRLLWRCLPNHASSTATTSESSSPPSGGQVLVKASIPPMDGRIAESCCQANTVRTLASLPSHEKTKELSVAYLTATKPCSRFRTNLHAASSAPAIVSSIPPSNALTALMMFLFCYQLVHELLTPSFARNICYTRHSGTVLSE